jgi:hypothetical protein
MLDLAALFSLAGQAPNAISQVTNFYNRQKRF